MQRFIAPVLVFALGLGTTATQAQPLPLRDRVEGLLIGALVGDAAGGPVEFQPAQRGPWTAVDTPLTDASRQALATAFHLRPYDRAGAPYAHWTDYGPPGTVTDDSRFKVLFMQALRRAGQPDRNVFAETLLATWADTTGPHAALRRAWLDEFAYSARWVLGQRGPDARPPERAWGGIPTMAGQMPFLPIAALHPNNPEAAYRATWDVDFLDNGTARDLNAALVAGLAAALTDDATWASVEQAMRTTDPYGFGEIEWVPRRLDRWLDRAHHMVARADGRPYRLYQILEAELGAETWWEAWVPMTVVFACAELADYDPLASMQLVLEFGYDTDSYLQVMGAILGALHGPTAFPTGIRETVAAQFQADYGVQLDAWVDTLMELAASAGH
ncbi:MAG: ADP-ribosylglycohydrolase family protein [Bacteroidota bacterium]